MSLRDPHLCIALKLQVQITGASQVSMAFTIILHHQMAYPIQNHASDIAVQNPHAGDALLLDDDSATTPSYTHVPR